MRKYLVVANQTLLGAGLRDEISKRIGAGPSSFYVLVPNTKAAHYLAVPVAGGMLPMPAVVDYDAPVSDEEASEQAQRRLDQTVADLADLDVPVEGSLGAPNPIEAISALLEERRFDEIIVATLPRRLSRWLRADVPSKAERRFGLPVTTIITER
jgi:nucleotide-binding universal stress UspA family protein